MMNKHLSAWLLPVFFLLSLTLSSAQEYGFASYYSDRYQGRRTAYGDTYDRTKKTCSHKKHPYGTLLRITRIDNKKSVICKVIDKGPYTKGRIVDVSLAAANEIGLVQDGVVEVKVEVYNSGQPLQKEVSTTPPPSVATPEVTQQQPERATQETPRQAEAAPATQAERRDEKPATVAAEAPASEKYAGKLVGQDYSKYGLYKIRVEKGPAAGFAVQVMVVSDYESAVRAVANYQGRGFDNILVSIEPGKQPAQTLYKVLLGPFDTEPQADSYQSSLKRRYRISGFVVNLGEKDYTAVPPATGAIKP